jgi:hypothetical protein
VRLSGICLWWDFDAIRLITSNGIFYLVKFDEIRWDLVRLWGYKIYEKLCHKGYGFSPSICDEFLQYEIGEISWDITRWDCLKISDDQASVGHIYKIQSCDVKLNNIQFPKALALSNTKSQCPWHRGYVHQRRACLCFRKCNTIKSIATFLCEVCRKEICVNISAKMYLCVTWYMTKQQSRISLDSNKIWMQILHVRVCVQCIVIE